MSILPLFVFSFLLAEFVAEAQQAQSDIFDDDITISSAAFANVRVFGVELRIVRASNHTNTKSNTFFYESRPWAVCNATKNEPCAFLKHRKVPAKRSLAVVGIEFDWAPDAVQQAARAETLRRLAELGEAVSPALVIVRPWPVVKLQMFFAEDGFDTRSFLPPFEWVTRSVSLAGASSRFTVEWLVAKQDLKSFEENIRLQRLSYRAPFLGRHVLANMVTINMTSAARARLHSKLVGSGNQTYVFRSDARSVVHSTLSSLAVSARIEQPSQFSWPLVNDLLGSVLGPREELTKDIIDQISGHTIDPQDMSCDKINRSLEAFRNKTFSHSQSSQTESDYDEAGASFNILGGLFGGGINGASSSASTASSMKQHFDEHDIHLEWDGTKYVCKKIYARRINEAFKGGDHVVSFDAQYIQKGERVLSGEVVLESVCGHLGCQRQCDDNDVCTESQMPPPLRNKDLDDVRRDLDVVVGQVKILRHDLAVAEAAIAELRVDGESLRKAMHDLSADIAGRLDREKFQRNTESLKVITYLPAYKTIEKVLWLEHGVLSLQARIEYGNLAGGNLPLCITVDGQPLDSDLVNKNNKFTFNSGITGTYRAGNGCWNLFYSPNFSGNNGPNDRGYHVLEGKAYEYAWRIGRNVSKVVFRNSGVAVGQDVVFKLE